MRRSLLLALTCAAVASQSGAALAKAAANSPAGGPPRWKQFSMVTQTYTPSQITTAVEGPQRQLVWFADYTANAIGYIAIGGKVTTFAMPPTQGGDPVGPQAITSGPLGEYYIANGGYGTINVTGANAYYCWAQNGPYTCPAGTSISVQNLSTPSGGSIVATSDGAAWFGAFYYSQILPNGSYPAVVQAIGNQLTAYLISVQQNANGVGTLVVGPDHNIWFVDKQQQTLDTLDVFGNVTAYALPGNPVDLVTGPDGNLWIPMRDQGTGVVTLAKVTTAGLATLMPLYNFNFFPPPKGGGGNTASLVAGQDGGLWIGFGSAVMRISTIGGDASAYPVPGTSGVSAIAPGADGNMWGFPTQGTVASVFQMGTIAAAPESLTLNLNQTVPLTFSEQHYRGTFAAGAQGPCTVTPTRGTTTVQVTGTAPGTCWVYATDTFSNGVVYVPVTVGSQARVRTIRLHATRRTVRRIHLSH